MFPLRPPVVLVAATMAGQPDVLLLDEPTGPDVDGHRKLLEGIDAVRQDRNPRCYGPATTSGWRTR